MRAVGRPPLLRPGWIVFALCTLNPVWWILGLGGFLWPMAAAPLIIWMLLRRDLQRPPGIALFGVYIAWALITVIRIDKVTRLMTFGMRYTIYVTAFALAFYTFNERRVTRTKFVDWVALFWVWAIIGGYLGLALPNVRLNKTPAAVLLPKAITGNDFVGNLVRPRLAQVQYFLGFPIPRPATLFAFTNEWGGAVGLLTPFFIAATLYSGDPRRRRWGVLGLLVAIPPVLLSVNRGLWISIAAISIVVAVRSFIAGRTAPLKALVGGIVLIAALLAFTPIGGVVTGRLSEGDAESRAGIYREAWEGALDSPILGWGGPRPSENPFSPSIGTHGHVFFAMFSHGFVGLGLYITWIGWAMYRSIFRRDEVSVMLASVVFVAALQMFFYNMFPVPLPLIGLTIGLLFRDDDRELERARRRAAGRLRPVEYPTSRSAAVETAAVGAGA